MLAVSQGMMSVMRGEAGAGLRWTRAAFLAAVAMLSGTVAHISAGGYLPGWTAMAWLFVAWLAAAAASLGRPASTLRVTMLVMAGQTFFHGALTALAGHAGDPPLARSTSGVAIRAVAMPVGGGGRTGSVVDQLSAHHGGVSTDLSVPAPVQHLLADLTGPHALMAAGHLLAAAVVGLWLAKGERALWVALRVGSDVARLALTAVLCRGWVACCSVGVALGLQRAHDLQMRRWHGPPDWLLRRQARRYVLADLVIRRGPPALLDA